MVFLGQVVLSSDTTSGTDYFEEWAIVEGPKVVCPFQLFASAGSTNIASLELALQTKMLTDADSAAVLVGAEVTVTLTEDVTNLTVGQTIGGVGTEVLKQLVRLRCTITAAVGGDPPAWACCRTLPFVWSRD